MNSLHLLMFSNSVGYVSYQLDTCCTVVLSLHEDHGLNSKAIPYGNLSQGNKEQVHDVFHLKDDVSCLKVELKEANGNIAWLDKNSLIRFTPDELQAKSYS